MGRLGSRHDCGSVFPKRLGTKKYVGISPGKFGVKHCSSQLETTVVSSQLSKFADWGCF